MASRTTLPVKVDTPATVSPPLSVEIPLTSKKLVLKLLVLAIPVRDDPSPMNDVAVTLPSTVKSPGVDETALVRLKAL